MIRRAFRPAISLLLLMGFAAHSASGDFHPTPTPTRHGNLTMRLKPSLHHPPSTNLHPPTNQTCHDSYSAASFETANDDLQEFIDEYFHDASIPLFPSKPQLKHLGLIARGNGVYQKPHALKTAGGHRRYPVTPGLWKAVDLGGGVWTYHLLIREPQQLAETQAFNTDNDLLGEPFADYDDRAYIMLLQPEDVRRRFAGRFFTINAHVFGLRDDATALPFTVSDIILTDYTTWVEQNRRCQAQRERP